MKKQEVTSLHLTLWSAADIDVANVCDPSINHVVINNRIYALRPAKVVTCKDTLAGKLKELTVFDGTPAQVINRLNKAVKSGAKEEKEVARWILSYLGVEKLELSLCTWANIGGRNSVVYVSGKFAAVATTALGVLRSVEQNLKATRKAEAEVAREAAKEVAKEVAKAKAEARKQAAEARREAKKALNKSLADLLSEGYPVALLRDKLEELRRLA